MLSNLVFAYKQYLQIKTLAGRKQQLALTGLSLNHAAYELNL